MLHFPKLFKKRYLFQVSSDQDCLARNELESERMDIALPGTLENCSSHNDVFGEVKASLSV